MAQVRWTRSLWCDRVLGTGHVTNKVGTLPIALAAKSYGVPFYVARPCPTLDLVTDVSEWLLRA